MQRKYGGWNSGLILFSIVAGMASASSGATIVYQEGFDNALGTNYQGTEDQFFTESHSNFGASTAIIAGWQGATPVQRISLIRFDVTSLAGQYTSINSATLTLTEIETNLQWPDFGISVYEIAGANAGWIEGDDTGSAAEPGEPDWFHLAHDTTDWAGSAGLSTPGTDYLTPALATATYSSGGAGTDMNGTPYDLSLPASVIDQWANGNNAGMVLRKDDLTVQGLAQFASAQYTANADWRPMLTIDYTPIPEPAGLCLLGAGGLALVRRDRKR